MKAEEMARQMLGAVKEYVARETAPLLERIAELEARPQATDGKNGEDGLPGKSAYELAQEKGFQGSEFDWLQSLKGDPGINGSDGKDGRDGRDGYGEDGADGRDALEIEIVDMDEYRSYCRGTYATWRGGLVRSLRTTVPLASCDKSLEASGWQIVFNGYAGNEISLINERTVQVRSLLTSGEQTNEFSIPVMIDRGVYKSGEDYEPGDSVSWAGSVWICQEKTTDKPKDGKGWRLAVKRGRDGKDGTLTKNGNPHPVKIRKEDDQ